jgi:hypothetical protein
LADAKLVAVAGAFTVQEGEQMYPRSTPKLKLINSKLGSAPPTCRFLPNARFGLEALTVSSSLCTGLQFLWGTGSHYSRPGIAL